MTHVEYGAPVRKGRLLRRYKRFFADVTLGDSDEAVVAHTSNTGRMTGLLDVGNPVLVTYEPKPTRRLDYSLQAIHTGTTWVGCNTLIPNRLAKQAVLDGSILELADYAEVQSEVKVDGYGRLDLLCSASQTGAPPCYVEVKSVTLRDGEHALFPDAPSERGLRHLNTLMHLHAQGFACAMLYMVQRTDTECFSPAVDVDPAYAHALYDAYEAGVSVIVVEVAVTEAGVDITRRLPLAFLPVAPR